MKRHPKYRPAWERALDAVEPEPNTGCWLWTKHINNKGYGTIGINGRHRYVHRVLYEHFRGPIPHGLELDHMCRVPSCANPDHLRAVTHRENVMFSNCVTAINARKTHCPLGHPYDLHTPGDSRRCRPCKTRSNREAWERRKVRERAARASIEVQP